MLRAGIDRSRFLTNLFEKLVRLRVNAFPHHAPIVLPGHREERVQFFPTYGCRNAQDDGWKVHVHGWVYRPKESSLKRTAVLGVLRRAARLDRETLDAINLKGRLKPFLYDNKRRRRFTVAVGDVEFQLPHSTANGHFQATLEVADTDVSDAIANEQSAIPLSLVLPSSGEALSARAIPLIGHSGLSVISDIDDTIKISEVSDRRALFSNTFLRDFAAAPGMANAYRRIAAAGATVHYVSASPWQLFAPLAEMLQSSKFPTGSVHLRRLRLKDRSLKEFLRDTESAKRTVCVQLLCEFPQRRFVLVGDSGERDPEMYGGLARDFAEQIHTILIRNVSGETRGSGRMRAAFAGLSNDKWRLFDSNSGPDVESILAADIG